MSSPIATLEHRIINFHVISIVNQRQAICKLGVAFCPFKNLTFQENKTQ